MKRPIYLVSQPPDWVNQRGAPSFGVLYVAQALKNAGYRVKVFRYNHKRVDVIMDAVKEERPLFVGFSNFLCPELNYDITISKLLHSQGIPVVWGGIFSTVQPEVSMSADYIDYVVSGEGERPVVALAEAISREAPTAALMQEFRFISVTFGRKSPGFTPAQNRGKRR